MRVATKAGLVEVEGNPHPDPLVWPVCDTCGTAWVLRRSYSLSKGMQWFWLNDCSKPRSTCKGASVSMHDTEGEVPEGGR